MAALFVKNVILFDDQISMLVFNPGWKYRLINILRAYKGLSSNL
jgi:hypothetical protein